MLCSLRLIWHIYVPSRTYYTIDIFCSTYIIYILNNIFCSTTCFDIRHIWIIRHICSTTYICFQITHNVIEFCRKYVCHAPSTQASLSRVEVESTHTEGGLAAVGGLVACFEACVRIAADITRSGLRATCLCLSHWSKLAPFCLSTLAVCLLPFGQEHTLVIALYTQQTASQSFHDN